MKILLIDNYDSYTYILGHYLWEITGERPWIVKNDSLKIDEVISYRADAIVLSPGPGHPANSRDFGVCRLILERMQNTPVLGICLGHQGIGLWAGANIEKAPRVRHGKTSRLIHGASDLFEGIPREVRVMRYHSLSLSPDALPDSLQVLATSDDDNQIMALKVRRRPYWGVQFHPESIGTEYGKRLLKNFCALAASHRLEQSVKPVSKAEPLLTYQSVPWQDPEQIFALNYMKKPYAFWLDSSSRSLQGRYSVMGSATKALMVAGNRSYYLKDNGKWSRLSHENPWQLLRETFESESQSDTPPFPYGGGLFGYLGFEFGRAAEAPSRDVPPTAGWMPDALLLIPESYEVWDHLKNIRYKVRTGMPTSVARLQNLAGEEIPLKKFLSQQEKTPLAAIAEPSGISGTDLQEGERPGDPKKHTKPRPFLIRKDYLHCIEKAKQYISEGESYEICLTNEFTWKTSLSPWEHYRQLRKHNPAAYGALIKSPFGWVLSSSPERFLSVDGGKVVTEPIKGTLAKSRDPRVNLKLREELLHHPKIQSELFMITDLLRNDLARVCRPGSIRVRDLKKISELSNVLQLSSRIEGELQEGCTSMDLLQACFPGGSVTGAPKLRTLEIIQKLEGRRRRVYTGSIGYLGWNGGLRLNVAIRTLVQKDGRVWAGAGGAIVDESDPHEEWREVLWKLQSVRVSAEMAVKEAG